jgi:hypothetical protein
MAPNNPDNNELKIVVPPIVSERKLIFETKHILFPSWTIEKVIQFETICEYYHIAGCVKGQNIEVCLGPYFNANTSFTLGPQGELFIPALSEFVTVKNNGGTDNYLNITCVSGYLFKYSSGSAY